MELKQKGADAAIGAFKQLKVSLIWTSAIDLDLMAFYKTKEGSTGGVYSDNYAGGSLGDLNQFPFIQLSGDEGVGATGGDNREELRINKLDDFEELYICALNFTDATSNSNKVFADYDAKVEVVTDRNETHTVKLDSGQPGSVAVLCKFSSNFMGASLVNNSEVMNLDAFRSSIPGADKLKLASKVTLQSKGDSYALKTKGQSGEVLVNLNWNEHIQGQEPKGFLSKFKKEKGQAIDLDLGCLFEMQDGNKGAIQPLNQGFAKQGSLYQAPYIYHTGDDRTGAFAEGETIKINLEMIHLLKRVLIFTYIYEGVANWAASDGVVTVKMPSQPDIEVKMGTQDDSRGFCSIAMLEFETQEIKVTKLVTFHDGHSDCDKQYNWGLRWVAGSKD